MRLLETLFSRAGMSQAYGKYSQKSQFLKHFLTMGRSLGATPDLEGWASEMPGWKENHLRALVSPRAGTREMALVMLLLGAELYSLCAQDDWGDVLDDCVLGPHWLDILRGISGLLDGDAGRLDCGSISRLMQAIAHAGGLPEEKEL